MKTKKFNKGQLIRWAAIFVLGALSLYVGAARENYMLMGILWVCVAPLV